MKTKTFYLLAAAVLVLGLFAIRPAAAASVEPIFVEGNPTCQSLGYAYEYKVDPPASGTYPLIGGSVTVTTDGIYFDWTSTIGIDAVIAKGGPNANLYVYDPPAESFGDTGLVSPINPNNDKPYGLSHISFCYDLNVVVTKTANPTFTRTWSWTIDKSVTPATWDLFKGDSGTSKYEVLVTKTGYVDSAWAVSGTISIYNPAPDPATITGVSDVISGYGAVTPDCGVTFPYSLAAGGTLHCMYATGLPDATSRTNTATAVLQNYDYSYLLVATPSGTTNYTGTANVSFAGATMTEIDECIDVEDDQYGDLGTVCYSEVPKTFTYSLWVGPYDECGDYQYVNIVSFVTNDTETTGSDSWTVDIHVPCGGCTLTIGYWKTHSKYGPAPYDDTWALLGEDTLFYLSGKTYYQVMWTPPAGNPYYILAPQFIAAKLNILNGAGTTAQVDSIMALAHNWFSVYPPTTPMSKLTKATLVAYAEVLDDYNNGYIGPGHCSE